MANAPPQIVAIEEDPFDSKKYRDKSNGIRELFLGGALLLMHVRLIFHGRLHAFPDHEAFSPRPR